MKLVVSFMICLVFSLAAAAEVTVSPVVIQDWQTVLGATYPISVTNVGDDTRKVFLSLGRFDQTPDGRITLDGGIAAGQWASTYVQLDRDSMMVEAGETATIVVTVENPPSPSVFPVVFVGLSNGEMTSRVAVLLLLSVKEPAQSLTITRVVGGEDELLLDVQNQGTVHQEFRGSVVAMDSEAVEKGRFRVPRLQILPQRQRRVVVPLPPATTHVRIESAQLAEPLDLAMD